MIRIKLDKDDIAQLRAGEVPLALIKRIDVCLLDNEIFADFVTAAKEMHEKEGEVEIDSSASVSIAEGGCYVEAWVYMPNQAVGRVDPIEDGEKA